MSKMVLIIDDQEAAAEAIADCCRKLGLFTTIVTSPAEAEAVFQKTSPNLVVIDLFLPGTDGYTVGQKIRSKPGGASVPMIAVSGVMKQSTVIRDVWNKLKGDFLPKPFDIQALQALVSRRLGLETQQPECVPTSPRTRKLAIPKAQPFQSDLRRDPVYRIFPRLYEQRASGHLELIRGKGRRRLTFFQGRLRFATSNIKQENAGGMQVARGELEEAAFAKAIELARAQQMSIGDALVASKVMSRADVQKALGEQVRAVAIGALGWADGQARFELDQDGAESTPDHAVHPLEMVIRGIAHHYPASSIKSFLEARKKAYVHRTELMEREMFILRKSTPGEQLTTVINGDSTLENVLKKTRDQDLALLFALVGTGLVKLHKSPQASRASHEEQPRSTPPQGLAQNLAPSSPPASVASSPVTPSEARSGGAGRVGGDTNSDDPLTSEERSAKTAIEAEHERVQNATLYEVLGVTTLADASAIQAAYREAASRWHVDRFGGQNLGEARRLLEEIFARLGEAREVLSSKERREEYDVYLDRKAKGLPTDVETILKAEGCFQDGEKLVKAGKPDRALEKFEEAISLNNSEPEFYAWRGYARFRAQGESSRKEALEDIDRSLRADNTMAAPNFFLGMMALQENNLEEASRLFKRVLARHPTHAEAQQQLRSIKTRQEQKGGLLGKLFKKS